MAGAFVAERGFVANKTSGATTVITPSSNVTAGNKLVLFIARDGDSISGITDSKGNTYAQAGIDANNAGNVRTSIWYSDIGTALVGGTDTITVTWGSAEVAKAIRTVEYSGLATGAPANVEDQTGTTQPFGFGGLPLASGGIAVAALGWEGVSADYGINVADWTERSLVATTGGGATTNISVQAADCTVAGTPNFTGSMATNRDWALVAAAWNQSAGGGVSVTPSPVAIPLVVPVGSIVVGVIVTPDPVATVLVIPTGSVSSGGPVTVTPSPVTIPLVLPTPTVAVGVVVAPSPVAIPLVLPTPTVSAGGGSVNVTPSPVAIPIVVPVPAGVSADSPIVVLNPPYPAIGNAILELWARNAGWAEWGTGIWGTSVWDTMAWHDVTPESLHAEVRWGASDPVGILSVTESGTFLVNTYDPQRKLDPANLSALWHDFLRPGSKMRLSFDAPVAGKRNVRIAQIDEIEYSLINKIGRIQGTDGIAMLSAAKGPAPTQEYVDNEASTLLSGRIQYALENASVDPSKPGGVTTTIPNVPVGKLDVEQQSAWFTIARAALDALYAVYINRSGQIAVRNFLSPVNSGVNIGGATGIPVSDLGHDVSMSGVFTQVVAYDESLPEHPVVKTDPDGVYIYGIVPFERTRPVPGAEAWAQAVVDDRSNDAVGRLRIGTLRPRTEAEVLAITETLQHMATVVHVFVDSVSPPVAIDAVIVGGAIEVNTRSGWSARLVAYVPDWG